MAGAGRADDLDNAAGLLDAAGRWAELDSVRDACATRAQRVSDACAARDATAAAW